jgi:hypothetical protein
MYIFLIVFFGLIPLGIAWFIGRHRKIGFWLSLILCIVTSPLIGFFITSNSALRYPIGCKWCGNVDNEAQYCGLCGKNWDGTTKQGYMKHDES